MKLLFCYNCGDVFNLRLHEVRSCTCGDVKGRYINSQDAEVNGKGISLAIDNGSLWKASTASQGLTVDPREAGLQGHPAALLAWARPHEGPANPHCRINKDL